MSAPAIGTILNTSWGYDQTNVEFFKVINTRGKSIVELRELEQHRVGEALCTEAKRVLYLFETALTGELERQRVRPGGKPIASTLKVQHRMHPVLCELVSQTFYGGELTTSDKRRKQAEEQADWIASKSREVLPELPVVVVNMPYERSAPGRGRIERLPRFTNPDEVAEVVRMVSQLAVSNHCCPVR